MNAAAQPAVSGPLGGGSVLGGHQQQEHHHAGDLVSLASGGGENPVPAGPPVPPAEPHVSAALVGPVPGGAPQVRPAPPVRLETDPRRPCSRLEALCTVHSLMTQLLSMEQWPARSENHHTALCL